MTNDGLMHCNLEISHGAASSLGSARALACRLRRPRRNGLAQGEEWTAPMQSGPEKVRDDEASSPAREGACAPQTAATIPRLCSRFISYVAPMTNDEFDLGIGFVIRAFSFVRHSTLVIRHL